MNGVCQTRSGLSWNILEPNPEDVRLEDIAHALSNQCRYNGHTREFYSVAEHSVRVASCLPTELRLAGLMHDAAETYLGDIIRPLKPLISGYDEIEDLTLEVILDGLGLTHLFSDLLPDKHPDIEYADKITILSTESRDLMHRDEWQRINPEVYDVEFMAAALPSRIVAWGQHKAERAFMDAYLYLTDEPGLRSWGVWS